MNAARSTVRPRPVFCAIAHLHRDLDVAMAVCHGRFSHLGITLQLGVEPDWFSSALPVDEEWRIEWSKFYDGLDLAYAFQHSGEQRFLATWERLVRSWIGQVPCDHDSSDVTGRRIQNWIYAWEAFSRAADFPGFSADFVELLLASLALQIRHVRTHLTAERNHRTLELYALLIAALALPVLDPFGLLGKFAFHELHQNLLTDMRPDGVHREASTHYHLIALRSFVGARENARRFGLPVPAGYDARLTLACEFALHCHRPDGTIPAFSDSDTGSYADVLQLAASLLKRADFLYSASAGASGIAPRQRYVSFPEGGYFIQRSGWGQQHTPLAQERFLMFDCGPLGDGGHGHYDLLHVEIAAGGRALLIDPGRYTYAEEMPNWRRWFKSTAAHNTVCVDGLDQTPYRRGKPQGAVAQGHFLGRSSAPGLDVLYGEARSPVYEAIHRRRILFVAEEYWVIEDRLLGTQPHHYDLRFHLAPEAWQATTLHRHGDHALVRAPGFALLCVGPYQPVLEDGWIAPRYGEKLPAPVVSLVAKGVPTATFLTLVLPHADHAPVPTLQVDSPADSPRLALTICGVGADASACDRLVWSDTAIDFTLGPFQGQASLAWWRTTKAGRSLTFRACQTMAAPGMRQEITTPPQLSWVQWDDDLAQAQGASL